MTRAYKHTGYPGATVDTRPDHTRAAIEARVQEQRRAPKEVCGRCGGTGLHLMREHLRLALSCLRACCERQPYVRTKDVAAESEGLPPTGTHNALVELESMGFVERRRFPGHGRGDWWRPIAAEESTHG